MDRYLNKIKRKELAHCWPQLLAIFLTITLLSHRLPGMSACCQSDKVVSKVEVNTSEDCPFHQNSGQVASVGKKASGFSPTNSEKKSSSSGAPMCRSLCCGTFFLFFSQDPTPNLAPRVLKRNFIPIQVSLIKDVVVLPWRPPLPQFLS